MSKSPTSQHLKTLTGSTAVVIKGESQQEYDQGREATIRDIGAQSPLEVYLAEKMFDCSWWIRPLDAMRVDVIRDGMVQALDYFQRNAEIRELIAREARDDSAMQKGLQASELSADTQPVAGMIKAEKSLESMDKKIGNTNGLVDLLSQKIPIFCLNDKHDPQSYGDTWFLKEVGFAVGVCDSEVQLKQSISEYLSGGDFYYKCPGKLADIFLLCLET